MLKSYEITLDGDKVKWLGEKPTKKITQAILVIEEEENFTPIKTEKRSTPAHLKGKIKILGDVVNPMVDEEDWQCLK